MSFVCDICHNSTSSFYTKLMVEIREKDKEKNEINSSDISTFVKEKSKMSHIECCSSEQINQILLSQAEDQITFYKDIINLIKEEKETGYNNNFFKRINNFEQKYGSFDEIIQSTVIDRDIYTFALIAELKRKNQKASQ
jgi:transcription elongation factor Elf1